MKSIQKGADKMDSYSFWGPMPSMYHDPRFPIAYSNMTNPYNMQGPIPSSQSVPNYQGEYSHNQNPYYMPQQMYAPMQEEMFTPNEPNPYASNQSPMSQQPMNVPQGYMPPQMAGMKTSPFANPLQTAKMQQQMAAQYPNPYPKQAFLQKQQPSGFQGILNQFKTQDGSMDVNKMMNTAGQMMGTVSQVQNMFKGLGGLFKAT